MFVPRKRDRRRCGTTRDSTGFRAFLGRCLRALLNLATICTLKTAATPPAPQHLAGLGPGKDVPSLDDEKKAEWRKQSIDWLKADLAAWSTILESGSPHAKLLITQTLQHWKADIDLAGLGDATALAKLPGEEQKACRTLWVEVDALLAKAQNSHPKSGR